MGDSGLSVFQAGHCHWQRNDPAIVWADEPTGDLDSENAEEIVELMRRLNVERGLTFLIVTHDIAVGRRTDRIVRMVDGEVRGQEIVGGR